MIGSYEKLNLNLNHSYTKLKKSKFFSNLDECINIKYNYKYLCFCLVRQPKKIFHKNNFHSNSSRPEDLFPITSGELIPIVINDIGQIIETMCDTSNDILCEPGYVKILMDSCFSSSMIQDDLVSMNNFNTKKTSSNRKSKIARSLSRN